MDVEVRIVWNDQFSLVGSHQITCAVFVAEVQHDYSSEARDAISF